jgi:predicted nucleotidyltransferase
VTFQKMNRRPMAPQELEQLLSAEQERVLTVCQPRFLYLFGSAARGEMTDSSDLDLLVVVEDHVNLRELKKAYYKQRSHALHPVDILFFRESEFNARKAIGGVCYLAMTEGRILCQTDQSGGSRG